MAKKKSDIEVEKWTWPIKVTFQSTDFGQVDVWLEDNGSVTVQDGMSRHDTARALQSVDLPKDPLTAHILWTILGKLHV